MTKCSVARQKKFFPTHDVGTHVVDDDQKHHVGEGLGAVFPVAADQSNTGAFRDTGEFLEQVSRRSLSIGFAQLTLPLSPCYPLLLEKDNAFVDFATPGRSALEPGSPRFQHLCQSFSATL